MGGGKTSTSSSTVSIPPEVLARYNAVNAQAEQVAQTPFQQYSTDPNAFVAPINQTQQAGINQIQSNMGSAQPYYDVATGLTMAGAGPANLGQLNTNQYMSPYLQNVVGTTLAAQQMQNAQQASQLQGQQATQGAFGGDRGNIGLSNLAYQQNLANQQALAGQLQSGYTQAQNTAAQQQGAQLAAQQANLARLTQAGQAIGGLGTAAQNAAITGGQAALTAGTVPQQTQQAGLTALYNQFLQQQGYPFQTAQFLANIAEGTGALSGSTTTTTGPAPFFSDERLKKDVETIGKTFDGQKIVKFRYKGQHGPKQIGLVAQDVEKHHPEAVGEQNGYKTVDYDKATDEAARRGHYYAGGLVPNSQGGAVGPEHAGLGFAGGGLVDPMDLQQLVAARAQMYAPYASGGLYGQQSGSTPGAKGIVPTANLPTPKLVTASTPSTQQTPVGKQIMSDIGDLKEGVSDFNWAKQGLMGTPAQSYTKDGSTYTTPAQPGLISQAKSWLDSSQQQSSGNARGGVIGRYHYDDGGEVDDNKDHAIPYGGDSIVGEVAKEGEKSPQMLKAAQTAQAGGQGSTAGNLLGAASTLKGLYGLGSDVAGGLGNLAGGFNAATNAATLDSVLGSGFSAANIGLGAGGASAAGTGLMGSIGSGLGSFFSSLGPAAMFLPFKDGGVVPQRKNFKPGGTADDGNSDNSNQPAAPDYVSMAESSAKNAGIDPDQYKSMIKGESGFTPTPGDDNSSGGLLQLHIGGASDRYPNSGLGDAYLNEKAPDLAKNGSAQEKLAFLNDPKNQQDQLDWGANYIAKNGANPWTQAHKQGLFGAAPLDSGSSQPSKQQSSGILADIGSAADSVGNWYDKNQNWLVPLATGLGTMASSPSRYLGAAILQGIGGAAQASQRQQLQQSQIAKNTMGMFADRFTPVPGGMYDKYLNQTMPIDQFRQKYGDVLNSIMGFNKGSTAPSAQAATGNKPVLNVPQQLQGPALPGTSQQTSTQVTPAAPVSTQQAAQSYPLQPQAFNYDTARKSYLNDPSVQTGDKRTDPNVWLNEADRLDQQAREYLQVPTEANKALAAQNQAIASNNRDRAEAMIKTALQPQIAAGDEAQKAITKQNIDTYYGQQKSAIDAKNRYQQAEQAYSTVFNPDGSIALQTGKLASNLHDLGSTLENLGVPSDWVARNIQDPARYEELAKSTPQLATEIAKQALGPENQLRVAEFNQFIKGVPNEQILPRTIQYLVKNNIEPQAQLEIDTWNHVKGMNPALHDVSGEVQKYKNEHPWFNQQTEQQQPSLPSKAEAAEILRKRQALRQQGNQ
jgi:Chaperone of endosialidase